MMRFLSTPQENHPFFGRIIFRQIRGDQRLFQGSQCVIRHDWLNAVVASIGAHRRKRLSQKPVRVQQKLWCSAGVSQDDPLFARCLYALSKVILG